MPADDQDQELAGRFDIRQWRRRHALPERIEDPPQVKGVTALLARDLSERLGACEESRQPIQGRTLRGNAGEPGCSGSVSA
jgi:hypothetical protein